MALTAKQQDINRIEQDAVGRGYSKTVKVSARLVPVR